MNFHNHLHTFLLAAILGIQVGQLTQDDPLWLSVAVGCGLFAGGWLVAWLLSPKE